MNRNITMSKDSYGSCAAWTVAETLAEVVLVACVETAAVLVCVLVE
jgi:hypothetical protein